jgi:hypothetical protein
MVWMGVMELCHKKLRGASECVLEFLDNFFGIFVFVFNCVHLTSDMAVIEGNA